VKPIVPFLDVGATYVELKVDIDDAVARVLEGGWYLLGRELEAFETEWAAYVGAKHCIGVANGLDALLLSLRALGVGHGDEVIVPSNTYIATWLAVTHLGATVVPVEPDPRTYNIDPERVEQAITPRTRVLLPVHLYGQAADMPSLLEIAQRRGLRVLEDAAQAHGARYRGARVGALGDLAAWSFYPGKNLGAFGDGGAVTTNDDSLADAVRVLRNYGSRVKYVNEREGFNSRLDDLQAAVLRVKLRHLDEWNARRKRAAAVYERELADSDLRLPAVDPSADPVWHLYVVEANRRDALQRALSDAGVQTLIHYPIPPHRQEAYQRLKFMPNAFPIAQEMAQSVLSLPIGPHLDPEQQQRVIDAVSAYAPA